MLSQCTLFQWAIQFQGRAGDCWAPLAAGLCAIWGLPCSLSAVESRVASNVSGPKGGLGVPTLISGLFGLLFCPSCPPHWFILCCPSCMTTAEECWRTGYAQVGGCHGGGGKSCLLMQTLPVTLWAPLAALKGLGPVAGRGRLSFLRCPWLQHSPGSGPKRRGKRCGPTKAFKGQRSFLLPSWSLPTSIAPPLPPLFCFPSPCYLSPCTLEPSRAARPCSEPA